MEILNDNQCSWINDLSRRTKIRKLNSNISSEWLIVGAGYTGLSAARKLGQIYADQKILLVKIKFLFKEIGPKIVVGNRKFVHKIFIRKKYIFFFLCQILVAIKKILFQRFFV